MGNPSMHRLQFIIALLIVSSAAPAKASLDSTSENGINSASLGLTGQGVGIGQVEPERPGDPDINDNGTIFEAGVDDDGAHSNFKTNPKAVVIENGIAATPNSNAEIISPGVNPGDPATPHATEVAGVMISADPFAPGVAPEALLYASAIARPTAVSDPFDKIALGAQYVATRNGGDVRAINFSFLTFFTTGHSFDGNSKVTQFVDWSAAAHDVLYVQGGDETSLPAGFAQPTDNFNGITIGALAKPTNETVYRQVAQFNRYNQHPDSNRTLVDLLAPGQGVELATIGGPVPPPMRDGTSFAAPHVTGTVALLQQYGNGRFGSPHWDEDYRRHQVMKSVLMNSADKLKDDGSWIAPSGNPVPLGGLLGMQKTILKKDGVSTWFDSTAYGDSVEENGGFVPLDNEMGTGALNAKRALIQFQGGEHDPNGADVPPVGWDYDTTGGIGFAGINRYKIDQDLDANSFISITLAWDRNVEFLNDGGTQGAFDAGDTFKDYTQDPNAPQADSVINDLVLWLLPRGAFTTADAIATSDFNEGTVQHIFFQLPSTGQYEIWVEQRDAETAVGTTQSYGIAWWAKSATLLAQGDFNGDGMVNAADLTVWQSNFGTGSGGDADGDGDTDGADFLAWQQGLGTSAATAASSSVPEPAAWILAAVGLTAGRRWGV